MKKIKYLLLITLFCLTGCFKSNSMDDIKIATSIYPIEYVVKVLYGEHSTITSIYPHDSNIMDFKITKVLLKNYSSNDLFIFNGLTEEKDYVKSMKNYNKKLMIIDATSNIIYDNAIEELWLDPNNLLTIANNIKNGFKEYIDSKYLTNQIEENYKNLKIELTNLDGKFYSSVKNAKHKKIIVTNNSFKFLSKYGLEVISLDKETATQKDFMDAKDAINDGECKYIFTEYKEKVEDDVDKLISETGANTLEFYTMTNLDELDIEKNNYMYLMNTNLENLRIELYK